MIDFGTKDLQAAIANDYLEAGEGSTTADKGWRMQPVVGKSGSTTSTTSTSTSTSGAFQESRLSFAHIQAAQGTVILNSAGAYISHTLAASSLAALDGMDGAVAGLCLNVYITPRHAHVSAPPHTDYQDVVVVQTQGRKHWRIYSPPTTSCTDNPFARGKGVGNDLPLSLLESSGSKLLLDVIMTPGDLLFVPARFPHTTDTLLVSSSCHESDTTDTTDTTDDTDDTDDTDTTKSDEQEPNNGSSNKEDDDDDNDWSMHLTIGLDSHVWSMNYLSMRRFGLRRFGVKDVLLRSSSNNDDDNDDDDDGAYMGLANSQLSDDLREALFSSVDRCLLSKKETNDQAAVLEKVAMDLFVVTEQISKELLHDDGSNNNNNNNENDGSITKTTTTTTTTLSLVQCIEIVTQFRHMGQKIMQTHRNMYTSAMKEEQVRNNSSGGWSADNLTSNDQIERLSLFRVPTYFEQLDDIREELRRWAANDGTESSSDGDNGASVSSWSASQSILTGDQVEVRTSTTEAGWTPAKVIYARADGRFDLQHFDGSFKQGVRRQDMKGPHGIGIFI